MPVPTNAMRRDFPNLHWYTETSDPTARYNCHAWGADTNAVWWEPARPDQHPSFPWARIYWPAGLPLYDLSLANFRRAHGSVGFEVCIDGTFDDGFEKVAHYMIGLDVQHTARQLPWGTWTSKLGMGMDIEHGDPQALEGPKYGAVAGYMRRRSQAKLVPPASGLLFAKP